MSQIQPDRLLRFRAYSGVQVFYPSESLRGIYRDGNHAVFCFTPLLNAVGEGDTGTGESDRVKILFSNPGDGMWGAIIDFYNKLRTTKSSVYTVADAAAGHNFYGFGDNNVNVDNSVLPDTVTIEISAV